MSWPRSTTTILVTLLSGKRKGHRTRPPTSQKRVPRKPALSVEELEPRITPDGASVTAWSDTYSVPHNQYLTVNKPGVLANDWIWSSGSVVVTLTTNVSHGTLDFRGSGAFRYRPNDGFVGTDSFTYTVDNSTATVTINVTNTAPTGVPDQYTLSHDEKFVVLVSNGVLANDTDPEDDFLTASLVSTTSHGTLALSSNGTLYLHAQFRLHRH